MTKLKSVKAGQLKNKRHLDTRELQFLAKYYSPSSDTYKKAPESAVAAGYSKVTATVQGVRILERWEDLSFLGSTKAVGLDNVYIASVLADIIANGHTRERLAAIQTLLKIQGDLKDSGESNAINVNGPAMIIVGSSEERIKALSNGGNVQKAPEVLPEPISTIPAQVVESPVIDVEVVSVGETKANELQTPS